MHITNYNKNSIMTKLIAAAVYGTILAPVAVFAQTTASPTATAARSISSIIQMIQTWISWLLPIMISVAILFFFYGLATYLYSDGEDKQKGLNRMMMGILAVFVMASLGGIVALLQNTFGTGGQQNLNAPCVGSLCGQS